MTENVLISIKGLQMGKDTSPESIADQYEGRYFFREGMHYLMYNEDYGNGEETTKCLIKIGFNDVCVTKRGAVNVEIPFRVGAKKLVNYDTQFGGFTLGFKTKNISRNETENSMELHIDYVLDMNYEYMADCHISIMVKEKEPE